MPQALIIDDDPAVHVRFQRDFAETDISVITSETAQQGLNAVQQHRPDVVVLDVMLPDLSGLDTYGRIRDLDAHIPVIFITTSGESSTAIEAMTLGAYDYLVKPLDRQQLRELVARAIDIHRLMETPVELAESRSSTDQQGDILIGRCHAMQEVYKAIGRVAAQDVTVLIQGESGTGKELVARAIYQHSRRSTGPFLAINCAAIPESLLESEMFGHEKGSFTGAERRRVGKFEQCSSGTLFLDEIGDMSSATQSKILRVLQQQNFERVGGSETISTDVRIIAATNVDLEKAVTNGDFRTDLFYRLNVFTIKLPPLRERADDLPALLDHFLGRFGRQLEKNIQSIDPQTLAVLQQYSWPGNIRELESVLKQALLQATGSVLMPDFLPPHVFREGAISGAPNVEHVGERSDFQQFLRRQMETGTEELYSQSLERMERELIVFVLRHTGGNQLQAAKILGITRGSLRNKIRSLGVVIDRVVSPE